MRHPQLLNSANSLLMVVDLQEAFKPHIPDWNGIVNRTRILIQTAQLLGLPILVTEQYPKGLGHTEKPRRHL